MYEDIWATRSNAISATTIIYTESPNTKEVTETSGNTESIWHSGVRLQEVASKADEKRLDSQPFLRLADA